MLQYYQGQQQQDGDQVSRVLPVCCNLFGLLQAASKRCLESRMPAEIPRMTVTAASMDCLHTACIPAYVLVPRYIVYLTARRKSCISMLRFVVNNVNYQPQQHQLTHQRLRTPLLPPASASCRCPFRIIQI